MIHDTVSRVKDLNLKWHSLQKLLNNGELPAAWQFVSKKYHKEFKASKANVII